MENKFYAVGKIFLLASALVFFLFALNSCKKETLLENEPEFYNKEKLLQKIQESGFKPNTSIYKLTAEKGPMAFFDENGNLKKFPKKNINNIRRTSSACDDVDAISDAAIYI